jgi:hypothetical protein
MTGVVTVRPHFDSEFPCPGGGGGSGPSGRLSLLLSCASWKDNTWADALPRLLEPMGVASVRAHSAKEAEQVIRLSPVHIAVVDLGLPLDASANDESGSRVLELLMRLQAPPPTVVIRSNRTSRDTQRDLSAALRWGAFAVVDRTAADLEMMLQVMQRCLCRFYANRWPSGS